MLGIERIPDTGPRITEKKAETMDHQVAALAAIAASCDAVQIAKSSVYTATSYSNAIDRLVDDQRRDGETVAKAHTRLGEESAVYKSLYRGMANAPIERPSFVAPERPIAKLNDAEVQLEELTKSIQQPTESHAKAYTRALETDQGRRLYGELANGQAATVGQD